MRCNDNEFTFVFILQRLLWCGDFIRRVIYLPLHPLKAHKFCIDASLATDITLKNKIHFFSFEMDFLLSLKNEYFFFFFAVNDDRYGSYARNEQNANRITLTDVSRTWSYRIQICKYYLLIY